MLVWAMLILFVIDNKKTVWHPQCGAWAIALLAEALLFVIGLGHGLPKSAFVHLRLTVQACRLLLLVALPLVLFSERLRATVVTDEETASLLGQTRTATDDAQSLKGDTQYGSIAKPPTEASPDDDQKEVEEERQKLEKGLRDSGNWFKYGFPPDSYTMVCTAVPSQLPTGLSNAYGSIPLVLANKK